MVKVCNHCGAPIAFGGFVRNARYCTDCRVVHGPCAWCGKIVQRRRIDCVSQSMLLLCSRRCSLRYYYRRPAVQVSRESIKHPHSPAVALPRGMITLNEAAPWLNLTLGELATRLFEHPELTAIVSGPHDQRWLIDRDLFVQYVVGEWTTPRQRIIIPTSNEDRRLSN